MNIKIKNADIAVDSEGDEVTCIGDPKGGGSISIIDSAVNMSILAGTPIDLSAGSNEVQIKNSSVNSIINNKKITHNNN